MKMQKKKNVSFQLANRVWSSTWGHFYNGISEMNSGQNYQQKHLISFPPFLLCSDNKGKDHPILVTSTLITPFLMATEVTSESICFYLKCKIFEFFLTSYGQVECPSKLNDANCTFRMQYPETSLDMTHTRSSRLSKPPQCLERNPRKDPILKFEKSCKERAGIGPCSL